MSAREEILAVVRDRLPAVPPLPLVPDFTSGAGDLIDLFTAAMEQLAGKVLTAPPSGIQSWLVTAFPGARRICSATSEVTGTVDPSEFPDWAAPADVDVTIVRTPLGVAETGSVLLTENELTVTAGPASGRPVGPRRHCAEHPPRLSAPRLRAGRLRRAAVRTLRLRRHRGRHGPPRTGCDHIDGGVVAARRRLTRHIRASRRGAARTSRAQLARACKSADQASEGLQN
jgi:hypothetical protein